MREVPEWIGRTDNSTIPPRVKVRIFLLANGRCQNCKRFISGKLIAEYDHVTALANGGKHCESNLQLLCIECHGQKTKADVAEKSRVYRKRSKFIGVAPKRKSIQSRGFAKAEPQRTASRPIERRT